MFLKLTPLSVKSPTKFMKKISLFIIFLFLSGIAVHAQQTGAAAIVKPDARALNQIKSGKAYLVDVRTPEEFKTGHLLNAINIDFYSPDFRKQLTKLDKRKPVYLYCRSGNRSGKSTDTLSALGFKEFCNIGGFEALKEQGLQEYKSQVAAAGK